MKIRYWASRTMAVTKGRTITLEEVHKTAIQTVNASEKELLRKTPQRFH